MFHAHHSIQFITDASCILQTHSRDIPDAKLWHSIHLPEVDGEFLLGLHPDVVVSRNENSI